MLTPKAVVFLDYILKEIELLREQNIVKQGIETSVEISIPFSRAMALAKGDAFIRVSLAYCTSFVVECCAVVWFTSDL